MSDPARWKVAEIILRLELEPTLREAYVEGEGDQHFLNWFFQSIGARSTKAYPIQGVEVPIAMLSQYGLRGGSRDSVIALAAELEGAAGEPRVACVIDRDHESLVGSTHEYPTLLRTDYADLDMYLVDEPVLEKFLNLVIGCYEPSAGALVSILTPPLTELFLLRVAMLMVRGQYAWLPFSRCATVVEDRIELDREEFVTRLLHKNDAHNDRGAVLKEVDNLRKGVSGDRRSFMNGHDFVDLFTWYLAQRGVVLKPRFGDHLAILSALRGCVDLGRLKEEPLFAELEARLGS